MARKKVVSKKKTTPAKKKTSQKSINKSAKSKIAKNKKKVLAIPKGYHSITPYLIIDGASQAINFYKKAFSAKERMRMERPDGKILHAELKIGDAKIMLADECSEVNAFGPHKYNGTPVSIHLYIKDVDNVVNKAISMGAKLIRPVADMFFGDRNGTLEDPYGHKWTVSTHIEDVTPAKMKKRVAESFNKS